MNGRQERVGDVWHLSARSCDVRIHRGRLPVVVAAGICQSSRRHCPEAAVSSTLGSLQASRPDISTGVISSSRMRDQNARSHKTSKSHTTLQDRNPWAEVDNLLDEQHVATIEPLVGITQPDGLVDKQGGQSADALWESEVDWPRNYPMKSSRYYRDPKQALWGVGNGALGPTTSIEKTSEGLFACEVAVQIPSGDKWRTRAEMPRKVTYMTVVHGLPFLTNIQHRSKPKSSRVKICSRSFTFLGFCPRFSHILSLLVDPRDEITKSTCTNMLLSLIAYQHVR